MKKNFYYDLPLKLFVIIVVLYSNIIFAEGSKDLYPLGVPGRRASLDIRMATPGFSTYAAHYVFAKEGENIAMASSASYQATVSPKITMTAPNGSTVTLTYTSGDGRIANRAQEIAGPLRFSEPANGSKYKPIYYKVPVGGTGIYKVEFKIDNVSGGTNVLSDEIADADWALYIKSYNLVSAWDISVINTSNTGFITGRVFTNVFNFGLSKDDSNGSYAKIYALTKDGYIYKISLNGMNGINSTFFVNSTGVKDPSSGAPTYQSLNTIDASEINSKVHSPLAADTGTQITHKLFYNPPALADFPNISSGAVPGGTTWLKAPVLSYAISNIKLSGISNLKNILFTSNAPSTSYKITISSPSGDFADRIINGFAIEGENSVSWDSKDGNGNNVKKGNINIKVELNNILSAEVHFPFFDVEYNRKGFFIELIDNNNLNLVLSDKVYWNDSSITHNNLIGSPVDPINNSHLPPANSSGISSKSNGHIWGKDLVSGGNIVGGGSWGNEKVIDTWTFAKSSATSNMAIAQIQEICTKIGSTGTPDNFTKLGVLTKAGITNSTTNAGITTNWPENVPNGYLVMDSSDKGFVITHLTTAQRNLLVPVTGMLIYNTDLSCVQLYRGTTPGIDGSRTGWNCITRSCNDY